MSVQATETVATVLCIYGALTESALKESLPLVVWRPFFFVTTVDRVSPLTWTTFPVKATNDSPSGQCHYNNNLLFSIDSIMEKK